MNQPPGEGILFISKKYFKDKRMNFFKGILSGLLSLINIDEALAIIPKLFEPIVLEFSAKNITEEDRRKISRYLLIAEKGGEALDLISEILQSINSGKHIEIEKLDRLRRWAIPESYRESEVLKE